MYNALPCDEFDGAQDDQAAMSLIQKQSLSLKIEYER